MAECSECGEVCDMPYECSFCGRTLCGEHRLPESHECDSDVKRFEKGDGEEDDSRRLRDRVPSREDIPTASPSDRPHPTRLTLNNESSRLRWLRNSMAYVFLGAMWVMFGLQFLLMPLLGVDVGSDTWLALFTLSTDNPLYVWTWVTSIFSHSGLFHIFGNSLVIFFFAPMVEKRIGSGRFVTFAVLTGVLAGIGQLGLSLYFGETARILGASGAALGILGVITVLNPRLRIFIFPLPIPMPLYILTGLYAAATVVGLLGGGIGAGGVAQVAHFVGLALGLLYGKRLKPHVSKPKRLRAS